MVTSDVLSFWKLRGHLPGAYFPGAYFYFLMSLLMIFGHCNDTRCFRYE